MTTIKVSSMTRDRLKAQAQRVRRSLGDYLIDLADEADRRARFESLRRVIATTADDAWVSHAHETADWERTELADTRRDAMPDISHGSIAWTIMEPVKGREQGGHRPVLVVSSADYLDVVTTLAIVVPITSVDRGWPNHVPVRGQAGLPSGSWAMTEQIRTISRGRITRVDGLASHQCMAEVRQWIADFLDLSATA